MALIVIEGMSAVGKSTTAPLVAQEIGAIYLPSIPEQFGAARRLVDSQEDVNVRHLFYAVALAAQGPSIREAIRTHRHVLLESYIDRADVFHRAMGSVQHVDRSLFLEPDLRILIDCEETIRIARLKRRAKPIVPYWHDRAEACSASIRNLYGSLCALRVDNSTGTPAGLVREIVSAVRPRLNGRTENHDE